MPNIDRSRRFQSLAAATLSFPLVTSSGIIRWSILFSFALASLCATTSILRRGHVEGGNEGIRLSFAMWSLGLSCYHVLSCVIMSCSSYIERWARQPINCWYHIHASMQLTISTRNTQGNLHCTTWRKTVVVTCSLVSYLARFDDSSTDQVLARRGVLYTLFHHPWWRREIAS